MNATLEQRKNFQIIGNGHGVHWPEVDEDISAIGMLDGIPAKPTKQPVLMINIQTCSTKISVAIPWGSLLYSSF
jgi:hypothetical protein